jgi:hypothetical protein
MKCFHAFACALALALLSSAPAFADDDPMAFARAGMAVGRDHAASATHAAGRGGNASVGEPLRLSGAVPEMIASAAARTIGAGWTSAMVTIARIEGGLRCSPGGNGGGLYQFVRGTRARLGLSRAAAQSCSANISAAMRYAAGCIAQGASTFRHMAACWNSGSPYTRTARLERPYRRILRRA